MVQITTEILEEILADCDDDLDDDRLGLDEKYYDKNGDLKPKYQERDDRIRDLYVQGMTQAQIQQETGIRREYISRAIKRHDDWDFWKKRILMDKVRRRWAKGTAADEIASDLCISRKNVNAVLIDMGIIAGPNVQGRVKELMEQGYYRDEIYDHLRLSPSYKPPFKWTSTQEHPHIWLEDRSDDCIAALLDIGMSAKEVARDLKIDICAVERVIYLGQQGGGL